MTTDLRGRYEALRHSADPIERAVAEGQLALLRGPRRRTDAPRNRSAWLHVPLAGLFEEAGNVLRNRPDGRIVCGHEPVHASKTATCLVIWPDEGRWWCSSCRAGGDAVQAVRSLEGCTYRAALARLVDRYGRPEGWR